MTQDTPRGIAGIRLHNIGRFEAFSLALQDGEIVEIHGDNDEGKSTIPECIVAALFGTTREKTSANHAATDGTGLMEVEVAGYTITRKVNAAGDTVSLEVIDRHGSRPYTGKAIQTWLDGTFGKLKGKAAGCFVNPFELMGLPKKEQIAAIVRALPIDLDHARDRIRAIGGRDIDHVSIDTAEGVFAAISKLDKNYREDRLKAGKDKDVAEAAWKAAAEAIPSNYDPDSPPPVAPQPMQELYDRRAAIRQANDRRAEINRRLAANDQEIMRLEEQIAKLRNANSAMNDELAKLGQPQDTAVLDEQIANHERTMQVYQKALEDHGDLKRRRVERDSRYEELKGLEAKHAALDGKVKALAKLPAELFARADLPIQGLFIEGESIMLPHPETGELRPAEEYGDAALLDLYIALSMALAPIPVILADGLERCGPRRSQEIYDRIRAKGFQLIGTRVTEGELRAQSINPDGTADAKALSVVVGGQPATLPVTMGHQGAAPDDDEMDFEVPEIE